MQFSTKPVLSSRTSDGISLYTSSVYRERDPVSTLKEKRKKKKGRSRSSDYRGTIYLDQDHKRQNLSISAQILLSVHLRNKTGRVFIAFDILPLRGVARHRRLLSCDMLKFVTSVTVRVVCALIAFNFRRGFGIRRKHFARIIFHSNDTISAWRSGTSKARSCHESSRG